MDNVACFVQTAGNRGNLLATKAVASRFSPTRFSTDLFWGGATAHQPVGEYRLLSVVSGW